MGFLKSVPNFDSALIPNIFVKKWYLISTPSISTTTKKKTSVLKTWPWVGGIYITFFYCEDSQQFFSFIVKKMEYYHTLQNLISTG